MTDDAVEFPKNGGLTERLLAIGRDCAIRLGPDLLTLDFDALLYDENGLPLERDDGAP